MFQHNLLIAFRNLQRHKGSFFINLIGLSTGLACTFLIYLWVHDELVFDKFHQNDSRLFQVMEKSKENGNTIVHEATQGMLAEAMAKDLPEISASVPVMSLEKEGMYVPVKTPEKTVKSTGLFAGPAFFKVFSFPLLRGNALKVLKDKNEIVISESLARSLFNSAGKAIGQSLEWELFGTKRQAVVSGVFAEPPRNNSMKFDFVLSYEMLMNDVAPNLQKWWNEGPSTYLLLKNGVDVKAFDHKIANFIQGYLKGSIFTLFTRPYSSAYLFGKYENGIQSGGRIDYVKLFSIVALFILLIACINFMNLSTARASRRLKEVGVKKTMGSTRKSLIVQFLTEAVFMAFLSLLLACVLVGLLLPVFNEITGKDLAITWSTDLVVVALATTLLTGLISGSYPAFYLSGFNPVEVLKGKLKASVGELLARKGLVVFQFVISLVLIISVMVIYRQVQYVQSKTLGYDKANVIYFDKEGTVNSNTAAFIDGLKKIRGVTNASSIQQNIVTGGTIGATTYGIQWPGKTDKELVNFIVRAVDFGMIETLGIRVKEGRVFSKDYGSEDTKLVFNEAAIKAMGLHDPVGKKVNMWQKDCSIIGVVKDFHVSSLHEAIAPMVFIYKPANTAMVMAKIEAGKERSTLERVENYYKAFNPGYLFEYKFLDEAYQAQYAAEKRVSLLSRYFAGLAILISCLGLFGLTTFNAEIRTKEIGIRKVLGASSNHVMLMLSKDFIKLVLIAIVIAFPLAWWAMNIWLSSFAYRVDVGPGVFILAGLAIIAVAIFTISYQALRTALMNPVKCLRTE